MHKPVLFFDFDNTLTEGDVLDRLIEKFSSNDQWRAWESAWANGRLSARDCLRYQMEGLRVSRDELLEFLSSVRVDPVFADILAWARPRRVEVKIVSDSFLPLIRHILRNNSIDSVPVMANDLRFSGDRLIPSFPFNDPACKRCANAKARHLAPYRGHNIIFAGDGHSDLDAALEASIVFAKNTLAKELGERSIPFRPFETLEPVLAYLESIGTSHRVALARIGRFA